MQRQIVITYPLATDITFWPTFACHGVIHAEFHLINSPTHLTTHPLMDVAQDSDMYIRPHPLWSTKQPAHAASSSISPNTPPRNHSRPAPTTPTATMTTTTGYEGTYPSTTTADPSLQAFLSNFYRLSDSPAHNDEWTAQFRDDAVIRLGPKTARGREGSNPLPEPPVGGRS